MNQQSFAYIFATPVQSAQPNCNGRVVAIQYCYNTTQEKLGSMQTIFNFIAFSSAGGTSYRQHSNDIPIQTIPVASNCTSGSNAQERICCDVSSLSSNDQFNIPSAALAIDVVIHNRDTQLLAFTNSVTQYSYTINPTSTIIFARCCINLEGGSQTIGLVLLRLLIGIKCRT